MSGRGRDLLSSLPCDRAWRTPLTTEERQEVCLLGHEMVRLEDEHRDLAREAVAEALYHTQRNEPLREVLPS